MAAAKEIASLDRRLADVEAKLHRLTWMVAANMTFTAAIGVLLWR